jgi:hypothetical protein
VGLFCTRALTAILNGAAPEATLGLYDRRRTLWQSSIGLQPAIRRQHGVDGRLRAVPRRRRKRSASNINLTFDEANGANYPFSNVSRRFDPLWGIIGMDAKTGWSNYHGLRAPVTKRFSSRWQASAAYMLSGFWNGDAQPISGFSEVPFTVANDIGRDYSLAATDQRHRAVFNGIWQVAASN